MKLENRLKEVRKNKGLTQQDLAEQVDVSRQTIIAIEKGNYEPSVKLALRIGESLGLHVEEVFFLVV
ncbi:MAG: helix-turn-helix transcriptional regulator [Gammaproteobacteria bacterium]|nr:helix-turn-helix transcriptional regulator [Gammaproteobacteria bacterium]